MAATAEDLARWAKFMYEGKAFDQTLLPQMFDGVFAPMLGRDAKYGLGVIIRPTRAGLAYGHSGFFPGYMTEMMYFPENKIAVAVQVNSSVSQNLGKLLGRVSVELYETITGKEAPPPPPKTTCAIARCAICPGSRARRRSATPPTGHGGCARE